MHPILVHCRKKVKQAHKWGTQIYFLNQRHRQSTAFLLHLGNLQQTIWILPNTKTTELHDNCNKKGKF